VLVGVERQPDEEQFLGGYFADSVLILSFLLPVLGILLVTGEWNHRTALTTFALVPKRGRVSVAKIAAGSAAGLGATAVSLVLASAATAVAAISGGADWSLRWSHVGSAALLLVLNVLMGIAFGMALLNSALAIVVYFFLPTIWAVLGATIPALRTAAEWLDTGQTMQALFASEVTAGSWARLAASVAVWVGLPLVIGLLRVGRREVS
jgi:ABC-type transport system involved in multi-copper enzyme maturation permease subunit